MKLALSLALIITSSEALANPMAYPRVPDPRLTVGSLCDKPDSYRYQEQMPYCERTINSFHKESIFIAYKNLGYSLSGERAQYKIDHYIPLCAGGSNLPNNLWPQYYTISKITDPIEDTGCKLLERGKLRSRDLVQLIIRAKNNLKDAPRILGQLKSIR